LYLTFAMFWGFFFINIWLLFIIISCLLEVLHETIKCAQNPPSCKKKAKIEQWRRKNDRWLWQSEIGRS
jgi:hypothetical protein